ncbi:unnamed protein product [Polarella glacialis]|uniref:Uncharacterized protein n=1 Tax=Polarella glacialis TaxID=89957 RepID=A0A813D5N5_POLGL|nr:unnamed protein product [Polarella glacialis]
MLMVVEGLTVSELTQIIGKLGTSALHMGRVCAARLVRLGGSESASESGGCNVRELILAVRALHSAGLLSALPGTVADLASLEILHNAAGSERCNDDVNLSELIGLLLCEPVLEPSVLRLAELLAGVPRSRRGSVLSGSLPSPSLLVRCEGAGAPQVAECMAGVYAATGERCHGLPVHERVWPPQSESQLPVRIYFWDAGAGDAAWWLGPETGGDLVWARSKALRQRPDRPPRRNWTLLQKNLVNLVIKVLACESPTASPGQHQVLQEEHRAAAPAEQSDGVDVVATPLPPPSRSRSRSREATSVASVGTCVAQKRFGAEDWEEWLRTLSPNPAPLMCYASSLAAEFDDLVQVAAFKRQGQKGTLDQVDPCFFKAVGAWISDMLVLRVCA